ncbi:hypothetical protein AB0J43_05410 [Nonomuraea fuscirosea]
MASFAHLAYVLERTADIMLGDHSLVPAEALRRAIWGYGPAAPPTESEMDDWYIARRVIDMQCDISGTSVRNAARHMAELFHRIDIGPEHPHVEGDDLDKVALLMWEQAHGLEMAGCS